MFAARPTTSPYSPTRLEEPRCRATLSRTDIPAPVCVARAFVLHRTPHWCPTPSADRIASHPFSRSLAPRVRCKTLLLPDVLRRWSSDHFLTLCDGSPELMGASGGGPDPPMAPGCNPASEMSPSPSPSPPPPPQPSLPSPTPPLPRAPPRLSLPSSSLHPPGQPLQRLRILPHAKARAAIASPKPMPEARIGATLWVRVCPHGARGPWVVPTRLAGTGFRLPVAVRAFACGLIWSPFRDCPGMSTGEAVGEARPEPPSTALPARRTPHRVSCVCGS